MGKVIVQFKWKSLKCVCTSDVEWRALKLYYYMYLDVLRLPDYYI